MSYYDFVYKKSLALKPKSLNHYFLISLLILITLATIFLASSYFTHKNKIITEIVSQSRSLTPEQISIAQRTLDIPAKPLTAKEIEIASKKKNL